MSNIVNIPDKAFKALLNFYLNQPEDVDITDSQLQGLTGAISTLYTYGNIIYNITGAEYLTNISEFDVSSFCQLSDVTPVLGLTNLKKLNTELSHLPPYAISVYEALINLQELYCDNITDLTGLEVHSNLSVLYIVSGTFTDTSPISSLTNLNSLRLQGNYSDVTSLSNLERLTYLFLSGDFLIDIAALSVLHNLNNLSIVNAPLLKDISSLSDLLQLKYLSISNTGASDVSALSPLISLETLSLEMNKINDIIALSTLVKLDSLDIIINPVSDLTPLSYMQQLTDLQMSSTLARDLTPIRNLVTLEGLDIATTQVTDFSPLATLTNLTYLYAHGIRSFYSGTIESNKFTFDNPVINTDGMLIPPLTISDSGTYDNGIITWTNLPSDTQNVSFTFAHNISAGQTSTTATGIVQIKLN